MNPLYTRHCPPSFWILVIRAFKNRDSKTPIFSFIPNFCTSSKTRVRASKTYPYCESVPQPLYSCFTMSSPVHNKDKLEASIQEVAKPAIYAAKLAMDLCLDELVFKLFPFSSSDL
ncbi:hypothetical protein PIB30_073598, partial [Stylosanthes scabra]|nr:hypothetical protein [Stylosanthes scabra]